MIIIDPSSGEPHPGLYRASLVKGGARVPCALCWGCPWIDPGYDADADDWCRPLDRGRGLRWYVNGAEAKLPDHWFPLQGDPIAADEYELLVRQARWDVAFAPQAPMANPRRKIDLMDVEMPF